MRRPSPQTGAQVLGSPLQVDLSVLTRNASRNLDFSGFSASSASVLGTRSTPPSFVLSTTSVLLSAIEYQTTFYYMDTNASQNYDLSGGTLPFTMGFRESPPLASTGVTAIRAVPGGFMIDSFFDVFTELSLDGYTWYPAGLAAHLTLSSENVTEARTSTWGAIKTLYR